MVLLMEGSIQALTGSKGVGERPWGIVERLTSAYVTVTGWPLHTSFHIHSIKAIAGPFSISA